MTSVYLKGSNDRYVVYCSDHATGSVETCAAISCLVYTLTGWLHGGGAEIIQEQLKDGEAMLIFTGDKAAKAAFEMVCVGFLQIQKTYPKYIRVTAENI